MQNTHQKYQPFCQVSLPDRTWPDQVIDHAPVWCSVDLRDGNQALVTPMQMEEKIEFFHALVRAGFKEIEVGFPSASQTEYDTLRTLIDGGHIPDDVTIQVLVQAREHLIRRTFEAIRGAKNVIVHFYNSTSTLQRKVVFGKDMQGITDIAVAGAKLIRQLTDDFVGQGTNIRFEYSPESFSGTEGDFAVSICSAVMQALRATREAPVILNLPSTVEMCTPNTYADQIEYFIRHLPNREAAIISVHPHNDRGTGVACAELALLAGAQRVEGTLFGNGERTGNLDIVTMALNMHTQGLDMGLDFSNLDALRELYERSTKMVVHERHPYAGKLAFTAFSGSHQDAIHKGYQYMQQSPTGMWEIPYLPIDPADVGRQYEPVIRINSQSGKGGAAFIMDSVYGYHLPKGMHPEFGHAVQSACEKKGDELTQQEIWGVFEKEYLEVSGPYSLRSFHFSFKGNGTRDEAVFEGKLGSDGREIPMQGSGNGPIDAFFSALGGADVQAVQGFRFLNYHEHAISGGSDSRAIAYVALETPEGTPVYGVGVDANINVATVLAILCAINRTVTRS